MTQFSQSPTASKWENGDAIPLGYASPIGMHSPTSCACTQLACSCSRPPHEIKAKGECVSFLLEPPPCSPALPLSL